MVKMLHTNCIAIKRIKDLKIFSTYKGGKNYYPQVYVEECKNTDAENQQCNMLIVDDDDDDDHDDGFFEV